MDLIYDVAQITADTTLSIQKTLWATIGIKPTLQKNNLSHLLVQEGAGAMLSRRIAGVSGAIAIMISAYGAHKVLVDHTIDQRRKKALENGNKYHFIHTIALLLASKARKPALTTALFAGGILLFSGPCYAFALGGHEAVRNVTPVGGILLILGWLSFVL